MNPLIPQVYLFVCLDENILPGALLQTIDLFKSEHWAKETVLVCNKSWKNYIPDCLPTIFIDKKDFFYSSKRIQDSKMIEDNIVNTNALENFLQQIDELDIKKVFQFGSISWGRWVQSYLSQIQSFPYKKIVLNNKKNFSVDIVNSLSQDFNFNFNESFKKNIHSKIIYIDPYKENHLCEYFKHLVQTSSGLWPEWIKIVCRQEDRDSFLKNFSDENILTFEEAYIGLSDKFFVCFDEKSVIAQASRSYNVALFSKKNKHFGSTAFVPGDIVIEMNEDLNYFEFVNVLSYWIKGRIKELGFQWLSTEINIEVIEGFFKRIVKKNIKKYSTDLSNCQDIVRYFKQGVQKQIQSRDYLHHLRNHTNQDMYSLSFSLKILKMIVDKMQEALFNKERALQRLGSDYHRIVIGEFLLESIVENQKKPLQKIDLIKKIEEFKKFIHELDFHNDVGYNEHELKAS